LGKVCYDVWTCAYVGRLQVFCLCGFVFVICVSVRCGGFLVLFVGDGFFLEICGLLQYVMYV